MLSSISYVEKVKRKKSINLITHDATLCSIYMMERIELEKQKQNKNDLEKKEIEKQIKLLDNKISELQNKDYSEYDDVYEDTYVLKYW